MKNIWICQLFFLSLYCKNKRYVTYSYTCYSRNSDIGKLTTCHMEDNSLYIQSVVLQYMVCYSLYSVLCPV